MTNATRLVVRSTTLPAISVLALATLTAFAPSARAADDTGIPDPSIATSLPANGDPLGLRKSLVERGLTYGIDYTADVNRNLSGGIKRDTHYAGLLNVYADINFGKAAGLPGLSFHASLYQLHGSSISGESVGGLAAVTNIEAFPSTRLFELWFEQKLFDEKLSIKIGQIATDEDFFGSEYGGHFFNSTFGWATLPSDNLPVGGSIFPIATPGLRVAVQPTDSLNLMAGIWNGDPVGPCPEDLDPGQCNRDGFDFRLNDPPVVFAEAQVSYNKDTSLAGTIKLGGWKHFGDFDDQRFDTDGAQLAVTGGTPFQHSGNHGLYIVADQRLMNLSEDGSRYVALFGRIAGSPSDRNQIDFYADGGIVISGPFATRPDDVFGVAVAYSGISNDASAFDRDSGSAIVRDYEVILQVSYNYVIKPGFTIQPDFQYFWNPGGSVEDPGRPGQAIEDSAVIGLRTSLNY
jgi:porin